MLFHKAKNIDHSKQIEERLNRTYKQNYYGTNGYDKIEGANSYIPYLLSFS